MSGKVKHDGILKQPLQGINWWREDSLHAWSLCEVQLTPKFVARFFIGGRITTPYGEWKTAKIEPPW